MTKPWIMDADSRRSAKYRETHLALKREVEADRKAKKASKRAISRAAEPSFLELAGR